MSAKRPKTYLAKANAALLTRRITRDEYKDILLGRAILDGQVLRYVSDFFVYAKTIYLHGRIV